MCVLIFLLRNPPHPHPNHHSGKEHRIEPPFDKGSSTKHQSLPPQREEAHHHAPILSTFDKSRSKPNPHQPQGMPQKNKPRNSKKNPRNRNSRPQQQQQRPQQYTHYCYSRGCTAATPVLCQHRLDHEDTYRTRITAGGDRIIQPRTVIEPRTVPQADHEDPADRFTRIGPAGDDFYWHDPGFLPPHP